MVQRIFRPPMETGWIDPDTSGTVHLRMGEGYDGEIDGGVDTCNDALRRYADRNHDWWLAGWADPSRASREG